MASKQLFLTLPGGVKMPALGLGTLFARDESVLENALITAIEAGYRHIDTAYVYENEAMIGRALKKLFDSGKIKREELFITTKLPMIAIYPEKVEPFLKKSLESLQLDYVDLYLVHSPLAARKLDKDSAEFEPKTDHIGVWKKMEEQVDAGRAKAIGLSNFNTKQIDKILNIARIKPANLQIEVYLYFQQREILDYCKKKGITVVAYAALGSAEFIKHINQGGTVNIELPDILTNPVVQKIATKHSKTSAQILLRHLLQKGIAVIPKSTNPSRIRENIDVFDFVLDVDDVRELDALDQGPKARIFDTKRRFKEVVNHPDYPYNE